MNLRRNLAVVLAAASVTAVSAFALTANAAPPAAYTGTNSAVDGPGTCLNGTGDVNCNIYTSKDHVWLNAGPAATSTGFGDGVYFFVVLEPGGGVNDDDAGNLSDLAGIVDDAGDAYTNRVFVNSGGAATYTGSHDVTDNGSGATKIRLMPYDTTSNPGGEYRIAICRIGDVGSDPADWDYPAGSNQCKRDNFKVEEGGNEEIPRDLTVTKNVEAYYDTRYEWTLDKSVGAVQVVDGVAHIPYSVTVTPSGPTDENWRVSGTIEVSNPTAGDVALTSVVDQLDGVPCDIDPANEFGGVYVVGAGAEISIGYSCAIASQPASYTGANTVTITWDQASAGTLGNTASDTVPYTYGLVDTIDECIAVSDSFQGGDAVALGEACMATVTWNYTQEVQVRMGCNTYSNLATGVTNDSGTELTDSTSVEICGPNGHTMGFWQNRNGQRLIGTDCTGARDYLRTMAPFQDLSATASCNALKSYVTSVIKSASSAGDSMNPMLKAQMLATALAVYFDDSAAGEQYFNGPLDDYVVDLTDICAGGYAASNCDVSGGFGGATSMTISDMLAYAAGQSNVGGTSWYGQVKAVQELAKNAFDAINNSKV